MQDLSTLLAKHINAAGLSVSDSQQQQLLLFVELLDKWNKTYNLTSVRDPKDMLIKHIMDSLCVGPHLQGDNFIDVGTGPGLPGIPLAILYPERQFTLLDSLGKRIRFIRQVVFQLKLANVEPVQARVEDFNPPQPFDAVLSRAFASLQDMVSWCQHLIDQHGRFYALKGLYPEQEIDNLPVTISFVSSQQIQVPELTGERHLIELTKKN